MLAGLAWHRRSLYARGLQCQSACVHRHRDHSSLSVYGCITWSARKCLVQPCHFHQTFGHALHLGRWRQMSLFSVLAFPLCCQQQAPVCVDEGTCLPCLPTRSCIPAIILHHFLMSASHKCTHLMFLCGLQAAALRASRRCEDSSGREISSTWAWPSIMQDLAIQNDRL